MKPVILILIPFWESYIAELTEQFEVRHAPTAQQRLDEVQARGETVDIVLTNGATGLRADEIDAMPRLAFASTLGAGYENVAVSHAKERGIVLATGAGTNEDCVADHALALMLATVRSIPRLDSACRRGVWRDELPIFPQISGKRLGVLGLGSIGRKIARRCEAFDMAVGYHNRTERVELGYRYFESPNALAQWCDILVVAAPGGPTTKHLVNRPVLSALGPDGFLVNIARGSLVDTQALAQALSSGEIRGAGIDVYEGEPKPPQALIELENVVLTPHVAGWSPESIDASVRCFMDNVALHLEGKPVNTPI
jgi:lactate dehydrogenase-like 2-hydroxyacid dehydrogenase